jgi:hypothetical protein
VQEREKMKRRRQIKEKELKDIKETVYLFVFYYQKYLYIKKGGPKEREH